MDQRSKENFGSHGSSRTRRAKSAKENGQRGARIKAVCSFFVLLRLDLLSRFGVAHRGGSRVSGLRAGVGVDLAAADPGEGPSDDDSSRGASSLSPVLKSSKRRGSEKDEGQAQNDEEDSGSTVDFDFGTVRPSHAPSSSTSTPASNPPTLVMHPPRASDPPPCRRNSVAPRPLPTIPSSSSSSSSFATASSSTPIVTAAMLRIHRERVDSAVESSSSSSSGSTGSTGSSSSSRSPRPTISYGQYQARLGSQAQSLAAFVESADDEIGQRVNRDDIGVIDGDMTQSGGPCWLAALSLTLLLALSSTEKSTKLLLLHLHPRDHFSHQNLPTQKRLRPLMMTLVMVTSLERTSIPCALHHVVNLLRLFFQLLSLRAAHLHPAPPLLVLPSINILQIRCASLSRACSCHFYFIFFVLQYRSS